MDKNNIIESLKDYFSGQKNLMLAFIFGSFITNKHSSESDIDIAILFKDKYTENDIEKIWSDIEHILHRNIDIVVLNESRPTIAWAALRGKPLLIRDFKFYLEYMLRISSEAEDYCEFILDLWKLRQRYKK